MRTLSLDYVLLSADAFDLQDIRYLRITNANVEFVDILAKLTRLEYLSMPGNLIWDLEPLARCQRLMTLHLSYNRVCDFGQLAWLEDLPNLQSLSLSGCPISRLPHYRLRIIQRLPQLSRIDCQRITGTEREMAVVLPFMISRTPTTVEEPPLLSHHPSRSGTWPQRMLSTRRKETECEPLPESWVPQARHSAEEAYVTLCAGTKVHRVSLEGPTGYTQKWESIPEKRIDPLVARLLKRCRGLFQRRTQAR